MLVLITISIILILLIATQSESLHLIAPHSKKDWIDVLTAFSSPVTGGIAVYIAWQQFQSSEKAGKASHLKYYQDNYKNVAMAVGIVVRKGQVSDEVIGLLLTASGDAKLYLEEVIVSFTDKLVDLALDISVLQDELLDMEQGPERIRKIRQKTELLKKLGGSRPHEMYRRYLVCD